MPLYMELMILCCLVIQFLDTLLHLHGVEERNYMSASVALSDLVDYRLLVGRGCVGTWSCKPISWIRVPILVSVDFSKNHLTIT